jgi:hypothetical protein
MVFKYGLLPSLVLSTQSTALNSTLMQPAYLRTTLRLKKFYKMP